MSGPKQNNYNGLSVPQNTGAKTRFEDASDTTDETCRRMSVDSKMSWSHDHGKGLEGLPDPDSFRRFSASPLQNGRASPFLGAGGDYPPTTIQPSRKQGKLWRFWTTNQGVVLVALSQLFGALMNLTARLLELEGEGMHPLQVLFARQSVTMVCCCLYMYWMKTPDFPLGKKEVRWLLLARGMTGFFGIFGMWYSMMYLPLAEATVITFLAPSVAGYICYLALREPFTRPEQIGTVIAFFGVVLIAHPASLFTGDSTSSAAATAPEHPTNGTAQSTLPGLNHQATTTERLTAIGVAILGVFGAAGAFTTIRWIGKRAHPLISVNYFATWCTIVCVVVLGAAPALELGQPALRFALPQTGRQWLFLVLLGVFGFIMQFLLTAGLGTDRSNRANAMVYTHMLFAAGFDRFIFGNVMGWMSLAGCGLIIGSALWVVLTKGPPPPKRENAADVEAANVRDTEAVPMLADMDGERDHDFELQRVQ